MKIKTKLVHIILLAIVIAILASYSSYFALADTEENYTTNILDRDFEDNGLIITTDDEYADTDYIGDVFKDFNVEEIIDLSPSLDANIFKINFAFHSKEKLLKIVNLLSDTQGINSIEPNYFGTFETSATYSLTDDNWWLDGEYGINLSNAWNITTGSYSVRVGVIDTGIFAHDALYKNLKPGWSFVDNSNSTTDTLGHGTQVAGIIGAVSSTVSGVNQEVSIVPLKVGTGRSWNDGDVIEAISYAQSLFGTENQIDILNMSGNVLGSHGLENAIKSYSGLFVCSAGNTNRNNESYEHYPSNYDLPNLIAVGAISSNGKRWEDDENTGSHFGKTTVDLFAPGDSIYTTTVGNGYTSTSGTSWAAPFVAGVAALIYAKYPCISAFEAKKAILDGVDEVEDLKDKCVTGGKLNAYKALSNAKPLHIYNGHYVNAVKLKKHNAFCVCGAFRAETHVTDLSSIYTINGHRYAKCKKCNATLDLDNTLVPTLPGELAIMELDDLILITNTAELIAYFRKSDYYDRFISYSDEITRYYDDTFFAEYILIGGGNATQSMIVNLVEQISHNEIS